MKTNKNIVQITKNIRDINLPSLHHNHFVLLLIKTLV